MNARCDQVKELVALSDLRLVTRCFVTPDSCLVSEMTTVTIVWFDNEGDIFSTLLHHASLDYNQT